jgi:ribosome-binding factor A
MSRLEKINELLRAELAHFITREVEFTNGLITITKVKTSPDLKKSTVIISVLPENLSGTALRQVRKNSKNLALKLKKLNLKYIPRLNWRIDSQARHAAELDKTFKELNNS